MHFTIYHNPNCSNSRGALALLREAGIEPEVVEYLKQPLDAGQLRALLAKAGLGAREAMRSKEALYSELKLDDPELTEEQLLDAIAAHPILMNRPFVATEDAARLCRPPELVRALLPEVN